MRAAVLAVAFALIGCTSSPEPAPRLAPGEAEPEAAPAAAEAPEAAEPTAYGSPIDGEMPLTPLSQIVSSPEDFRDQVVRTEGEIARVCQRAGCWMELREGDGVAVRVPMAGHSFFLPRDSAGRHAVMQGRVTIQELTQDVRDHLESEGAQATASALSIQATGVAIDGESAPTAQL